MLKMSKKAQKEGSSSSYSEARNKKSLRASQALQDLQQILFTERFYHLLHRRRLVSVNIHALTITLINSAYPGPAGQHRGTERGNQQARPASN